MTARGPAPEPNFRARKNPVFPYTRNADQDAAKPVRHPVVIVGAGPVGLSMALDLALRGVRCVVLDDEDTVSVGSRAICYAKRTLEIWDRLGVAQPMLNRGITWRRGRVRFGERLIYTFDLLPEGGHHMPAFINLQQYHMEELLVARAADLDNTEIRWRNGVTDVTPRKDHVVLAVDTPEGPYTLEADYVIAADGAHSTVRRKMGLDFKGRVFDDQFLICDIVMKADFPSERWFWFDPPFNRGQSALLHKQADDVWRLDFQIGKDADPELEKSPERLIPRIRNMLGDDIDFDIEWVSVYTFKCRRLAKFRHDRVFFAGDSAHQVSPFGARGANAGVQDADNLAWKLAMVMDGKAPDALLESYDLERGAAADENILNSSRSTDFITPKSEISRVFRDAVLDLAEHHTFAQPLVNSGRLSIATPYQESPLNTPDTDTFEGHMVPGAPLADAPVRDQGLAEWFLHKLSDGFCGLYFGDRDDIPHILDVDGLQVPIVAAGPRGIEDRKGFLVKRYDGAPGTFYLFRPDQRVAMRTRAFNKDKLSAAIRRSSGHLI